MFDRSAIEKLQELILSSDESMANLGAIALPDKMTIHDLERFRDRPKRHRRTFATDDVESFLSYVKRETGEPGEDAQTLVFVGPQQVLAILGASTPHAPRWEDHVAKLVIHHTPIHNALLDLQNRGLMSQRDLADWLTEWAEFIDHGIDTDNSGEIPVGKTIAAIRRMKITTDGDSTHVQEDYSASRSSLETIEVNSGETKIVGFKLWQPLFLGFDPVHITVRLTILPNKDSGPMFKARILRYEDLLLKQREIVAGTIEKYLPANVNVYVGEAR